MSPSLGLGAMTLKSCCRRSIISGVTRLKARTVFFVLERLIGTRLIGWRECEHANIHGRRLQRFKPFPILPRGGEDQEGLAAGQLYVANSV